jgi:thioesterase domain-containing protein
MRPLTLDSAPQFAPATEVRDESQSTLVAIQPGGTRPPLYLVHNVCGGIDCYKVLSKALGPDQPVYAFRHAFDESERELGIQELASIYIRDLLAFDHTGPHLLGGYSFGGLVAFEMAQQLEARGQRPAMVVMLDTWLPSYRTTLSVGEQAQIFSRNARALGLKYIWGKIVNKRHYWQRLAKNEFLQIAGWAFKRIGCNPPAIVREARVERVNMGSLWAYRPAYYAGYVLHMFCKDRQETLSKRGDPYLGWGILKDAHLEMYPIASDHSSLLKEPSTFLIAQYLQNILSPGASLVVGSKFASK